MRIRNRGNVQKGVSLQMTPMIDIVLQLLVFFIMTFNIVAEEGDFDMKTATSLPSDKAHLVEQPQSILVSLKANEAGQLVSASWNGTKFLTIPQASEGAALGFNENRGTAAGREERYGRQFVDALRAKVENHLSGLPELMKGKSEIEFECDYHLKYVWAIRALAGSKGKIIDGKMVPLIEEIKFTQSPKNNS